ncbi:MAG: L-ribulose-5-phosphate 3-epimerase, partial [Spirochaetales bacterium]|nr:L-ribulose-5-phosphate 3-epimerase [Spirochaetales bacterium]
EAAQARSLEIMDDAILLARDLGIRIIQIAGYDEYYNPSTPGTRENFLTNLRKAVTTAAREGVLLAFETMETDFINTVGKAAAYVKKIDSPYLQIYPDLGNITNAALTGGHTVPSDLESGRGHIAAMHLKETVPGKFRDIPYGTGHVNFEEGISIAFEQGVFLFVSEFWDTGKGDWREQLIRSREFMGRAFEQVSGGGL